MLHHLETIPVDSADIKRETKYDKLLFKVVDMVLSGQLVEKENKRCHGPLLHVAKQTDSRVPVLGQLSSDPSSTETTTA